jgi:hypothetical protein
MAIGVMGRNGTSHGNQKGKKKEIQKKTHLFFIMPHLSEFQKKIIPPFFSIWLVMDWGFIGNRGCSIMYKWWRECRRGVISIRWRSYKKTR